MPSVKVDVEELNLTAMEEMIGNDLREELLGIAESFDDAENRQGSVLKARVSIEVELEYDVERRSVHIAATVGTKLPKRRPRVRTAMLRNGTILVEPDPMAAQTGIPFNPSVINNKE